MCHISTFFSQKVKSFSRDLFLTLLGPNIHLTKAGGFQTHTALVLFCKLFLKHLPEINSWSPNSTDLYFWYLFVELMAVVTPVEWRNFVSVVPAAKIRLNRFWPEQNLFKQIWLGQNLFKYSQLVRGAGNHPFWVLCLFLSRFLLFRHASVSSTYPCK